VTTFPDSVLKHDGRNVAFDPAKFDRSVHAAALAALPELSAHDAAGIAAEIRARVCAQVLSEHKLAVSTADLRAVTTDVLKARCTPIAAAYAAHARYAAQLLWQLRVVDPRLAHSAELGTPWDRRRLLEALRRSGVAGDIAGRVARDVERQLVALRRTRVSPALIHALAALALTPDEQGANTYRARRVAFSALASQDDAEAEPPAGAVPLLVPATDAALEQFWLQCVHSPAVTQAVEHNLLALDPYPASQDEPDDTLAAHALDPLAADFLDRFAAVLVGGGRRCVVRADSPDRRSALGALCAILAARTHLRRKTARIQLLLRITTAVPGDTHRRAAPITLNAAGLAVREGLRDPRALIQRLGDVLDTAVLAHREREGFWGGSIVNGRPLPVAFCGLFNAAAWLLQQPFDAPFSRCLPRREAEALRQRGRRLPGAISGLVANTLGELSRGLTRAVQRARDVSGANLLATAQVPPSTAARLWKRDAAYFQRDGVHLNDAGAYTATLTLPLTPQAADFPTRLAALSELKQALDEPLAMSVTLPHPMRLQTPVRLHAPGEPADLPPPPLDWNTVFERLSALPTHAVHIQFGGGGGAAVLLRRLGKFAAGNPLFDALPANEESLFEVPAEERWADNRIVAR